MTVTVRADATVRFGPNHEVVAFRLYPNGAESWELQAEGPVAAGWTGFTAGQEYVFPLEFQRYDENAPRGSPGTWVLEMSFEGENSVPYAPRLTLEIHPE